MQIANIQAGALSSPIDPPQDRSFHGGTRRLLKRDVVLVIVETKDGRRGFATAGATSSTMREYFEGDSQSTFADVISGPVADVLEGETLAEASDVVDAIDDADLPRNLRKQSISAIDVAFYDLRGKEVGAPVYKLLADEYDTDPTTEIPLYASAGMYMEPEGYEKQAEQLEDLGFWGYKYRPGIGPDGDRRTVELLTDATDNMKVMLDAHTWWKLRDPYTEDEIRDIVEFADMRGAYWVEEPVTPDDYNGYRDLAATGASLAGGESEESPEELVELGRTGAVDFLQGDVRHHEGFTGCRGAINFCRGRDVEFVPHNFGTWFGLFANAHLVAAAPEVRLLEYPVFERDPVLTAESDSDPGMYPFDLAFDIVEGEPSISDGELALSDEPGLGVEINTDVVEEYPFTDGPWTEFHYEDE